MAERNPFDQQPKGPSEGTSRELDRKLNCEEWESLLADALDGLLPSQDSAAFTAHSKDCALCAQLLAQAKQGQEWMQFLHVEPEMPVDLVERIISRTSGAVAERPLAVFGAPIPAGGPEVMGIPMRRMVWDTRLMMTAAMAFFSIALTLNLAGVRITSLRLSALTPASLESNLTHQFYVAQSQVVHYYDNLRFVYQVESKLREMRQDEDTTPAAQPKQQQAPAPQANPPANHKTGGSLEIVPVVPQPDVVWGHPVLAGFREEKSGSRCRVPSHQTIRNQIASGKHDEVKTLVVLLVDQAEGSLA